LKRADPEKIEDVKLFFRLLPLRTHHTLGPRKATFVLIDPVTNHTHQPPLQGDLLLFFVLFSFSLKQQGANTLIFFKS
jgi:hypothetical protein